MEKRAAIFDENGVVVSVVIVNEVNGKAAGITKSHPLFGAFEIASTPVDVGSIRESRGSFRRPEAPSLPDQAQG